MENFDDEFGDLSGYKTLSFEEVSKGNKSLFSSSFGNSDKNIDYQSDEYVNLTMLLGNIKTANRNSGIMQYAYQEYQQEIAQTYIMDGEKHIDLSAKIGLKDGAIKVSNNLSRDRPYMEVFFDENDRLTYVLTFCYVDTHDTAIELRTHSFQEYRNLLLYLNYGDVEKDYDASTFFIREFTDFLKSSESSDDLYQVYGDLPTSFIVKIQLSTDVVAKHLKILTKEDDSGWFSWTRDTSSLLIKVMGMFRKFQEAADYFWKNPKVLTEIYDNLDGHSEILGQPMSNRILFASILNEFANRDKNAKSKIPKNALVSSGNYFIESNILELNDTLNAIKGIMSFDWDFDYREAIFLQQKKKSLKTYEVQETDEFGKGGSPVEQTHTVTEDIDPGYLYHPMNLVCYSYDPETGQKAELVTALFIKALADEKEWVEVMRYIRIGGDILAVIAGLITIGATGEVSALAVADLALASIDLSLMDEDLKKWLSETSAGKWFVENWDLIYALVGAGIMSVVVMEGILTYGPVLLENLKNLKNVKGNYRIFTEQLEKLIIELEAYQARNAVNVIEEVTLVGEKNGLLKKLLKPFLGTDANLEYIIEQLGKRNISVKKAGDNLYEIYYKGKLVTSADAKETGAFLKNNFYKTEKQLEELTEKLNVKIRRIVDSDGLRGSKALTLIEKQKIFNYAKQYFSENADELIQFADEMSTNNTGYMALMDVLYINTDIMPGTLDVANSRLGWKAAIAHELEGHRFAAINNKTFYDPNISAYANDLLEEMQASIRANKHGKDLSNIDKENLLQDAFERFTNHKKFLEGTEYESLTFEQIVEKLWISKH